VTVTLSLRRRHHMPQVGSRLPASGKQGRRFARWRRVSGLVRRQRVKRVRGREGRACQWAARLADACRTSLSAGQPLSCPAQPGGALRSDCAGAHHQLAPGHTRLPIQHPFRRALPGCQNWASAPTLDQTRSHPLICGFPAASPMLADEPLLPKGTETPADGIG
jgi:hypothetical protein